MIRPSQGWLRGNVKGSRDSPRPASGGREDVNRSDAIMVLMKRPLAD